MRDIRDDLRERLASLDGEIAQLQDRLEKMRSTYAAVEMLLQEEIAHWGDDSADDDQSAIEEFLEGQLQDGEVWSTDELRDLAKEQQIPMPGSPGRTIHMVLVNWSRAGRVENLGEGNWRWRQQGGRRLEPISEDGSTEPEVEQQEPYLEDDIPF